MSDPNQQDPKIKKSADSADVSLPALSIQQRLEHTVEAAIYDCLTQFIVRAQGRIAKGETASPTISSLRPEEAARQGEILIVRDEFILGLQRVEELYKRHFDSDEASNEIPQQFFDRILTDILSNHLLKLDRFSEALLLLDKDIISGLALSSNEVQQAAANAIAARIRQGERTDVHELGSKLVPRFFSPDNQEFKTAIKELLREHLRRGNYNEVISSINMLRPPISVLTETRDDAMTGIENNLPESVPYTLARTYNLFEFLSAGPNSRFEAAKIRFILDCLNHAEDDVENLSSLIELFGNYTPTQRIIDTVRDTARTTIERMVTHARKFWATDNDKAAGIVKGQLVQLIDIFKFPPIMLEKLEEIPTIVWEQPLLRRYDRNEY